MNAAPSHPAPTDVELVDAVSREFIVASDLDPAAIGVTASHGRIQLRGEVSSHAERLAAATHAARVAGVRGVDNYLVVRDLAVEPSELSDAEVETAVAQALVDSTVSIRDLRFEVQQHVVTLSGEVRSRRDRAAARYAVQHARGVHFVIDDLRVAGKAATEGVEELDPVACFQLLAKHSVGRLAITDEAGVDVFPVNYVLHDQVLYFRSGPGTKMLRLTASPQVAFEVDGHEHGFSWSVVVRGTATRLESDDEIMASGVLERASVHPTEKLNYVKILPTQVSGRRFTMRTT